MFDSLKKWLAHKLRNSWKLVVADIDEHNRWLLLNAPPEVLEGLYAYRQLADETLALAQRQKHQLAVYGVLVPKLIDACQPFLQKEYMDFDSPAFTLGVAVEALQNNTRHFSSRHEPPRA